METKSRTKQITIIGVLSAMAFIAVAVGRIPLVLFLKYDPKDIIIAIGGLIFGPLTSFLISLTVSFVEMVTISDTGILGFIMNVLSSCTFACTAAYIYNKKKTKKSAVIGLLSGLIFMTGAMLLWNYIITPIYMGIPRGEVVKLLTSAFLPFNLIKGGLNTLFTILLYEPVMKALRQAKVIPEGNDTSKMIKNN